MLKGKRLHALWACVMALVAVSGARTATADVKHNISKGDTVYAIAKRYHVSTEKILKANHLTEESILSLDRSITIPGVQPAKKALHPKKAHSAKKPGHAHKVTSTKTEGRGTKRADSPAAAATDEGTVSRDLIRAAVACRGTRYRFGGTSRGGFDCSGFTRYVYSRYGVPLPHSSRGQFSHGRPVSRGELQAGDLVFFHTNRSGISHVGIYIGGGKFVHASNVRRGVTVNGLGEAYYASRYRGARRVK